MKTICVVVLALLTGCHAPAAKKNMAIDARAVVSTDCPHADALCALLAGEVIAGRGACTDHHEQPPAAFSSVACANPNGVTLLVDPDTCLGVPVWCDFDHDGRIDGAADWTGRVALPGGCGGPLQLGSDLDCDGDSDLRDYAILQVWSAP